MLLAVVVIKSIIRKDLWPFLVLASVCIGGFEVASFFFSWSLGRQQVFGEYFDMFTSVSTDWVEYQKDLGRLWWDRPSAGLTGMTVAFKTIFFVFTVVILMNLLIGAHLGCALTCKLAVVSPASGLSVCALIYDAMLCGDVCCDDPHLNSGVDGSLCQNQRSRRGRVAAGQCQLGQRALRSYSITKSIQHR
jgi:hypothetical protein